MTLDDLLAEARSVETPDARLCARIARTFASAHDSVEAAAWAVRVVDGGPDATAWMNASNVLADHPIQRSATDVAVAVVGTATTDVLTAVLPVALARERITASVTQTGFGLYWQEILDPASSLRRGDPDVVVLIPHLGATAVGHFTEEPDVVVDREVTRWASAWSALRHERSHHVIQVGFVPPDADPLGHLGATSAGSTVAMARELNRRLAAEAARHDVAWVDRELLAARLGLDSWFDARYWFVAKHDPSMAAMPILAHHIAVVAAARLGLGRKCLVTDLDGTLWGGSIGDDGLGGIRVGGGADGEAHVELQRVMLALKERGVILAVCSKNNDEIARSPFVEHGEMVLGVDDFAAFVANWDPKPANLRLIAQRLNIGLDAITFVDDNPAEREAVRAELPEIDVLALPQDPSLYPLTLARHPRFETPTFSVEDRSRTEKYRARAAVEEARETAGSLEEFLVDLEMVATIGPVDETTESRVAQLLVKTNQWNLTTRRHTLDDVRRMTADGSWVTLTAHLRDRLADHGLVAVLLAREDGGEMSIDTFLMSCRVIGRRLEHAVIDALVEAAQRRGCATMTASYVPTDRNSLVADIYSSLGFECDRTDADGSTHWTLSVADATPLSPPIEVRNRLESQLTGGT